jgi:hypothetical protein
MMTVKARAWPGVAPRFGGDVGHGKGGTQKSVKSVHSLDCGLECREGYGAAAGNRTRVTSLEGSNLNHLTTAA